MLLKLFFFGYIYTNVDPIEVYEYIFFFFLNKNYKTRFKHTK